MDVIAHRGFAAEGVENARSRLVAAAAEADAVEFDVRLAADGEPVVFHDERVDRLTAHDGPVKSFTAAELGEMTLNGTDEGIPTLESILDALSGPIVAECKIPSVPDRLVALLLGYDDPVTASSFRPSALRDLPTGIERAVLCAPPDSAVELPADVTVGLDVGRAVAEELGADAIQPHHSLCTRSAVADCQAAGLSVVAWTIRAPETGAAMDEAGVDGVIADSPRFVDSE